MCGEPRVAAECTCTEREVGGRDPGTATRGRPPGLPPSEGDAVVAGLAAGAKRVIGQGHGDDRIGGMPAPEQIVFPAVQVLGIEHVDPRTDDLVPLDRRDVVAEEVGPDTPDHGDALELTVRFERREFPDGRPGTGGIVHRGSWKLIQQRADSLGHFRPRSPLDAVGGDELERRGIAAHDGGDGVVALLGPVDAGAVPRPGRIRPGSLGGESRLAAPAVFEIAR